MPGLMPKRLPQSLFSQFESSPKELFKVKKLIIKNFLFYNVPVLISKGINFITIPIITRYLTKEAIGTIAIFSFCTLPFTILMEFGAAYVIFSLWHNIDRDERKELLFNLLVISFFMSLLALLIVSFFSDFIFNNIIGSEWVKIRNLFGALLIVCFSDFASNIFMSWLVIEQKAKLNVLFNSFTIIFQSIVSICIIIATKDYVKVIWTNVILQVVANFIKIFILSMNVKFRIRKDYLVKTFEIGYPIFIRSVFATVKSQIDRLLVINRYGAVDFASYNFAGNFSKIFNEAGTNFGKSIDPVIYKQLSKGKIDLNNYQRTLFLWFYIILILSGVIFIFGKAIIGILTNNLFLDAYPFVLLYLCLTIISVQFIGNNILPVYYQKTKFILLLSIIEAFVAVPLVIIFISLFGISGALMALWLTNLLKFLIYFLYKWKLYPEWFIEKKVLLYVIAFHFLVFLRVFTTFKYANISVTLLLCITSIHFYFYEREFIQKFLSRAIKFLTGLRYSTGFKSAI